MCTTRPSLIFDLDGTLTDSKPGILACLRKVLDQRGMGDVGPLDRFIGPPVEAWVQDLLPNGSEEERAALASDYRELYGREGWNNNSVFPGVRELLQQLHQQGFPLYVCTSKHQPYALRILEAFGLAPFFRAVYGDRPEFATHNKTDLLALLLREQTLPAQATWMIGDRIHDIEAAHSNRLRCLAVKWGYGSAAEHALANAQAATPASVPGLLAPPRAADATGPATGMQPA